MRLGVSSNGDLADRKSDECQMSVYALGLDFGQVEGGAPTRTRTWNLMLRRHVHYPVVLWARGREVSHTREGLFHDIATLAVFTRNRLFGPNLQQLHERSRETQDDNTCPYGEGQMFRLSDTEQNGGHRSAVQSY